MKGFFLLSLLSMLVAGCTPSIPVQDAFGTSALVPAGEMPADFAEFNNYDPRANALLASQICATPYNQLEEHAIAADPGRILAWRGRCATYYPHL